MKSLIGFLLILCTLELAAQDVLVLGIAQDAGHPQADCHKQCCESVRSGESAGHLVASLAISDGRSFWIVDATPDFTDQLALAQKTFEGQKFSGVLLTHAHIGHYTGLMYLGREAMGSENVPVFVMPRMKKFLETSGPWDQLVSLKNIQLIQITDNQDFQLGEHLRIKPILVPHRDEYSETVGFSISGAQTKLLYIPDIDKWERWYHSLDQILIEFDHLLIDGTFYNGDELPGRDMNEVPHPTVSETIQTLLMVPEEEKRKITFIHLNHTNPLLDESSKAYQEVLSEGMRVAKEGELIRLY